MLYISTRAVNPAWTWILICFSGSELEFLPASGHREMHTYQMPWTCVAVALNARTGATLANWERHWSSDCRRVIRPPKTPQILHELSCPRDRALIDGGEFESWREKRSPCNNSVAPTRALLVPALHGNCQHTSSPTCSRPSLSRRAMSCLFCLVSNEPGPGRLQPHCLTFSYAASQC
ncbi:hypothetical protein HDV62DRAFT_117322 [Trichoderma sp. SZMC 28011]